MPSELTWVVSHWVGSPVRHIQQLPQAIWNGTTTRSPTWRSGTAAPTSSTIPIGSCPRMSPGVMNGVRTSYRCRSDPHSPVEVMRMIASVGSSIRGSGTFSTRTFRFPCQVSALISARSLRAAGVLLVRWASGYPRAVRPNRAQLGRSAERTARDHLRSTMASNDQKSAQSRHLMT
ncbi:hypothetical protein RKD26_000671 [Streptomyces calvus]